MPPPKNATKPHSRVHRGTVGAIKAVLELPAAGCALPVPDMPAGRDWTEVQRLRWESLWCSPQANHWDTTATGTVATLIVYETAIFEGSAAAWMAQEARYAAEALGLTPRALVALGWRIVE